MSRLSQFVGTNEFIKERFLFLSSEVWTVPESGEYRITALGGGGSLGVAGNDTVIVTPEGTITLKGGGQGGLGDVALGGVVESSIPGLNSRRGGNGSDVRGAVGLEMDLGQWRNFSEGILRGAGFSQSASIVFPMGGGAPGGGAGGAILDRSPLHLQKNSVLTITIAAPTNGGAGEPFGKHNGGLVLIDRY